MSKLTLVLLLLLLLGCGLKSINVEISSEGGETNATEQNVTR